MFYLCESEASATMFYVAKAKRQLQCFICAKAKRQQQNANRNGNQSHVMVAIYKCTHIELNVK
ncbi:hypothetical protein FJQ98_03105 [Lysinibacillus agricola]|uniref:Uncharacterized protein n=1 Tax=Lysinibacillus agricola TaxID=2590012 RepID=A0ABX7ASX7_9BACI|nr:MULTISPECIES: hypothetical protein [Lysinibacillus]QQP13078.1 hypothetical protein FJQ98_03105 [Lysinibacillus agricola]